MNSSEVQAIRRNRTNFQAMSRLVRTCMVIWLAVMLVAWAPVSASQVTNWEMVRLACNETLYWEYFLAHNPGSSPLPQSDCPPETAEVIQLDAGVWLYWESFQENNAGNPPFAQVIVLPITGGVVQPDAGASLYWEYFLENSPVGSSDAWFSALPEIKADFRP